MKMLRNDTRQIQKCNHRNLIKHIKERICEKFHIIQKFHNNHKMFQKGEE